MDNVRDFRGKLTSGYKKSGNVAYADVQVEGISKTDFYAHSRIDEFSGMLQDRVPDVSLQPKDPMFKATEAADKNGVPYLRNSDTEYKILNDVAAQLGDNTAAKGKIRLFTEKDTCDSCNRIISEFRAKYDGIEIEVIHNNGEMIIP